MFDIAKCIIYEDADMIVCNKPAGVLTQSGKSFDVDMVSALMTYRRKKKEDPYIGVINRLDRPVSGLVVFAKNNKSAAFLNRQLKEHSFNKCYYALICKRPEKKSGVFTDMLIKDEKTNMSRIAKEESGAKRAELEYEVIKDVDIKNEQTGESLEGCLVKIRLITGRHHQIRVQFSSRNMPIAGDIKYGAPLMSQKKKNQIALCACKLDIKAFDGTKKCFEIPYDYL